MDIDKPPKRMVMDIEQGETYVLEKIETAFGAILP